ncbi:lipopolysaccharide biosynthesis protein [Halobium salinum]|uniref:Lipopolysaccharide biosynthesis protein n=1 Tax=Halobium salinum TaxID=1364940 RepID=A0ABD5P785_9EURY|nr:oligosaccharide flippase family protein [Halobium salinum]
MKVGAEVSKRFVTNVGGTLAGFVGTAVIGYTLGEEGLGSYAIFLSLQMLLAAAVSFGLYNTVTKLVSAGGNRARHYTSGVLFVLGGTAVSAVVAVTLRGRIDRVIGVDGALLLPLGVLTYGLFRLTGAFLEGEGRVALAGLVENSRYLVIVAIQLVLLLGLEWGVRGLIWGLVAGQFVTFLVAYAYARVVPARPSRALFSEFVDFSKFAYLQTMSSQLFKHADYVLLGAFVGPGAAGIYKVSFTVTEAAMLFSAALSRVSFPEFSRLTAEERAEKVRNLLGKATSYAGLFALPALAGGAVVGNDLLATLFGVDPGTVVLPVLGTVGQGNVLVVLLALANLANGFRSSFESYFLGTDRPQVAAASSVLLILVYGAVFYPLVRAFDAAGLAVTTTLAFAVSVAYLVHRLDYPIPGEALRDIATQVAAALVMAVVVVVVTGLLGGAAGPVRLAAVLTVGAATYFASLVTLNERIRNDAVWVLRDLAAERGGGS